MISTQLGFEPGRLARLGLAAMLPCFPGLASAAVVRFGQSLAPADYDIHCDLHTHTQDTYTLSHFPAVAVTYIKVNHRSKENHR